MDHGGLVGEILYFVISTFFQRVGAHLAFTFMFLSGLLLLTGASIASVMRATGGAFSGRGRPGARADAGFARMVAGERAATPGAGTMEHGAATLSGGVFAEPEGEPEIRVLEDEEDEDDEEAKRKKSRWPTRSSSRPSGSRRRAAARRGRTGTSAGESSSRPRALADRR